MNKPKARLQTTKSKSLKAPYLHGTSSVMITSKTRLQQHAPIPRRVVATPDLSFFTDRREQSKRYLKNPARKHLRDQVAPAPSRVTFFPKVPVLKHGALQIKDSSPESEITVASQNEAIHSHQYTKSQLFLSDSSSGEIQELLHSARTRTSSSHSDQSTASTVAPSCSMTLRHPHLDMLATVASSRPRAYHSSTPRLASVSSPMWDPYDDLVSSSNESSAPTITLQPPSTPMKTSERSSFLGLSPRSRSTSTTFATDEEYGRSQTISKGDRHIQKTTESKKRMHIESSEDDYYRENYSPYKKERLRQATGPYIIHPAYYRPKDALPYTKQQRGHLVQALTFTMTFHNLRATAKDIAYKIYEENRELWPQLSTAEDTYDLLLAECHQVLQSFPFFDKHLEPGVFDVKKTRYSYNRNKDDNEERVEMANNARANKRPRSTRTCRSYKEEKVTINKEALKQDIDEYGLDRKFDR